MHQEQTLLLTPQSSLRCSSDLEILMNDHMTIENSLDATVTDEAFQMNDMVLVARAYPHCGFDAHKQGCSLDDQLA
jgi:hypothetical protein